MSALALLLAAGNGMDMADLLKPSWNISKEMSKNRWQNDQSQPFLQLSALLLSIAIVDGRVPTYPRLPTSSRRIGNARLSTQDTLDLNTLTVADLKDKLKSLGLKVSGNKGELIARLQEHTGDVDDSEPILGDSVGAPEAGPGDDLTEGNSDPEFQFGDLNEVDDEHLDELRELLADFNLPYLSKDADASEEADRIDALEDGAVGEVNAKTLGLLSVEELKEELEDRGLNVSGKKSELIDRLIEWEKAADEEDDVDIESLTISELKEELKYLGLQVSGTKQELVERLRPHWDDEDDEDDDEMLGPQWEDEDQAEDEDEDDGEPADGGLVYDPQEDDIYEAIKNDPLLNASRDHRAGFATIIGIPNVGKSTLMNTLLDDYLSITTSKAQTTRQRIVGIDNSEDHQIIYADTPGILRPQYKLQDGMMKWVRSSLDDIDIILLVVDVFQNVNSIFPDEKVLESVRSSPAALIVLVNKVDLVDDTVYPPPPEDMENAKEAAEFYSAEREQLRAQKAAERKLRLGSAEEQVQSWQEIFPGSTVLPIAAISGDGVDEVKDRIIALLPKHPPYYDKESISDKPDRFFAAEFLRQAIFEEYEQEVPYSCNTVVDSFKESDNLLLINASIYVAQESQKEILIGRGGKAIKRTGIRARQSLEEFFYKNVYLRTTVKVQKNWRDDVKSLEKFGYVEGEEE